MSLVSAADNQESCFCLGTFIYKSEETEPSSGRLLLFTAIPDLLKKSSLNLLMLTSAEVNGCVYALGAVGHNIVAAVNSAVSCLFFSFGMLSTPCIDTALPRGDIE